jgi:hypothetical protein
MGHSSSRSSAGRAPATDVALFPDTSSDEGFTDALRLHLQRLIVYADGSLPELQREVAEKLANEAVKPERQAQIVELGGLQLLLPLTKSGDLEIQRLAAHALANLSVLADNQVIMAREGRGRVLLVALSYWDCKHSCVAGALPMLVHLLQSPSELVQRQAAKGTYT